jgi:tryptophan-rich sensory protein
MKKNWKIYAFWIGLSEVVGAVSGFLSMDCMRSFKDTVAQPPLSPPGWVFPVAWTLLYALMGISAARIYLAPASRERSRGLNLYVAQLTVNFFWSLIFFNAQAFGFAFLWLLILWALVLWMILTFASTDATASRLQLPYLLWLTFAAYLNWAIWIGNQ